VLLHNLTQGLGAWSDRLPHVLVIGRTVQIGAIVRLIP